ncbi:hypothetical protein [Paenibacillus aceti]|uniref:Uncharacterized protein n=1 Tax=Paenibacillus aceti TaxID=1820010 RepID=A0ABQ1W9G8_9BACL|nr:hypothetical protein [Paenibacillus aceti]GGG20166.1 hypothetical protein GCM10010913_47930 [Paenibacillus aceti]
MNSRVLLRTIQDLMAYEVEDLDVSMFIEIDQLSGLGLNILNIEDELKYPWGNEYIGG